MACTMTIMSIKVNCTTVEYIIVIRTQLSVSVLHWTGLPTINYPQYSVTFTLRLILPNLRTKFLPLVEGKFPSMGNNYPFLLRVIFTLYIFYPILPTNWCSSEDNILPLFLG